MKKLKKGWDNSMLINSAGSLGQAYNTENYALQRQNYQTTSHKNQTISPESTVKISAEAKIKQVQEKSGDCLKLFKIDDMFSEDELKIFEEISSSTGDVESTKELKRRLALRRYAARTEGWIEPKLDADYTNYLIKGTILNGSNSGGMDLKYLYSVRDYLNGYKT